MLRNNTAVGRIAKLIVIFLIFPAISNADQIFEKTLKALSGNVRVYLVCEGVRCQCANCGQYEGDCWEEAEYLINRLGKEAKERSSYYVTAQFEYWDENATDFTRADKQNLAEIIKSEGGTHILYYSAESVFDRPEIVYNRAINQNILVGYNRTKQRYRFNLVNLSSGSSDIFSGGTGRLTVNEPLCQRCR